MDPLVTPPPNSARAERTVLCGLVREWEAVYPEVLRTGLTRDDLYGWRTRLVWDAVVGLVNAGRLVSPRAVWWRLGVAGQWCEFDGRRGCRRWLYETLALDPTGYWALREAARVRDLAERRRKIHEARRVIREAMAVPT